VLLRSRDGDILSSGEERSGREGVHCECVVRGEDVGESVASSEETVHVLRVILYHSVARRIYSSTSQTVGRKSSQIQ
jgi:hypothetical protein